MRGTGDKVDLAIAESLVSPIVGKDQPVLRVEALLSKETERACGDRRKL